MGRHPTAASSSSNFAALNPMLQSSQNISLAENTKASYRSGVKQFYDFCYGFKVHELGPIIPATELVLCYFVTFLSQSVQFDTIKCYLAAVRDLHIRNGFSLDIEKFQQLQYTLRGIKRYLGHGKRVRHPISISHLELFHKILSPHLALDIDNAMIWASFCLAFFGFMRISEFTCNGSFSSNIHLTVSDVVFQPSFDQPTHMQVFLKSSKTDQFREGITLTIGKSGSVICAVDSMKQYLSRRKPPTGPLFVYKNGQYLTKVSFTAELRRLLTSIGLTPNEFASHSFRRGAATAAAAARMPPWLIQTLGRWSSDCFKRYIELPPSTIIGTAKDLIQGQGSR